MHWVSILWKSGTITHHKTTGVTIERNRYDDRMTNVQSDKMVPTIVNCTPTDIVAVFTGKVRSR